MGRSCTTPLCIWLIAILVPLASYAQRPRAATVRTTQSATGLRIVVIVDDENGVAVQGARAQLAGTPTGASSPTYSCETDYAGRCVIRGLRPGNYVLHVDRAGFYRLVVPQVQVGQTDTIEARITHQQEIKESIDVQETVPAIDGEKTADTATLTATDVLNVPFPATHDIRNALPLLPGVIRDQAGNIHVGGASITQTMSVLDGFNIGTPTTSFDDMHVNTDAVRDIDIETGRYSAEYGKGTSVLGMGTGIGDDRFRFTATNFIPSFQMKRGLSFNQWVPRATFSGPIKKGRAWFFVAPDADYDQTIVTQLPPGADRTHFWTVSNLAKAQVNVTSSNILSTEFLVNSFHALNAGLSQFNPIESTQNQRETSWLASLRDQHYFQSGALLEAGLAVDQFTSSSTPVGDVPFVLRPGITEGGFFETSSGDARRTQVIANAFLPPRQWHGRHELKVGTDLDHITYSRDFLRKPILMTRSDETAIRRSAFPGTPVLALSNVEATLYGQDRWSPTDRLLVEYGLRMDWDRIIRDPLLSPRLAATYSFGKKQRTKVSAGIGTFYQATNLDLVAQDEAGARIDSFFAADGVSPLGPAVVTKFLVNRARLEEPRFTTSSVGLEHELPRAIYIRIDFTDKRGNNGFVFVNSNPTLAIGAFELTNSRKTRYDSLMLTGRHTFHEAYPFFVSYTRSRAHTNAVFDFNLGTPVVGLQSSGALPWDAPNRVVSWGWAPFIKKTLLGYAVEWRNGLPFSAINNAQQIAGTAQSYRFPDYFDLSISLEKRFHLMGYYLALRGTVSNVTSNSNPTFVDNNIDSPTFLTFQGTAHRSATARIRFLGRSQAKDGSSKTVDTERP